MLMNIGGIINSKELTMQEVQAVVEYSLDLQDLAKDPDMPKGLGPVSVFGGKFETENRTRELRDVFR